MPQTSPINWLVLSMFMILLTLHTLSYTNEKLNHKMQTKMKFNLIIWSWNW